MSSANTESLKAPLSKTSSRSSIIYHDLFDYPLTRNELRKWDSTAKLRHKNKLEYKNGYYLAKGRESIVKKRLKNKISSKNKLQIAHKAARLLSILPTIKTIAITGSLAMNNANEDSDIDLLVITSPQTLWTTRLLTLLVLDIAGIKRRRAGDKSQKNKICTNIWLDENSLSWPTKDRNIYTAHEIAQIKPLYSKDKTYEKLIYENSWITDFWPNAVKPIKQTSSQSHTFNSFDFNYSISQYFNVLVSIFLEPVAFRTQYIYMKPKITREVVTATRALFHPHDWSKKMLKRLKAKK